MRSKRLLRKVLLSLLGFLVALALVTGTFVAVALPFLLPDWLYWVVHGWRYPAVTQAGDAVLTDHGPRSAIDRYLIDLGPIDLSASGAHAYRLTLAPEIRLALGLELWTTASEAALRDVQERFLRREDVRGVDFARIQESIRERTPLDTVIAIRVVDEENRLVIEEKASLSDWVWATREGRAFVYRGGPGDWVPLDQGGWKYRRADMRVDQGWGTYFTPRTKGVYRITLTVAGPIPVSPELRARLIATGGGWK